MRLACRHCRYDAKPLVENEYKLYRCPECGVEDNACWIRPAPTIGRVVLLSCWPTATLCVVFAMVGVVWGAAFEFSRSAAPLIVFSGLFMLLSVPIAPILVAMRYSRGLYERPVGGWLVIIALLAIGLNALASLTTGTVVVLMESR
ncbi:MAG: hypothetical protein IT435_13825 [Phycisphaerales bacterium]|nr:hypothetical protein [Phycisphaerales bacterium]